MAADVLADRRISGQQEQPGGVFGNAELPCAEQSMPEDSTPRTLAT
jgi:hypothetical protein